MARSAPAQRPLPLYLERKVLKQLLPALLLISLPLMAKETLTVYTSSSFASSWGPGPAIKKAFEAQCDCELNLLGLSDGAAVLNRLRMEGKNSTADVILGLDNNLIANAEKTGLFAKHNLPTTSLQVPNGWKSDYFIPYDYGYFAFVYNKDKLPQPPTSMKALLSDENEWKIIYQDPRTSTPGLGLLLWIKTLYGDDAEQAWQRLATKTQTVTKGWSEAYGLFLKGEADLVLSYSTSPAYHIIDEKDNRYAAALFEEGHYLQIEVAGQLAASRHPQLASQFMAFITTPEFQQHIATKNWMYPVTDVALPEAFSELAKPENVLEIDAQQIEAHRTGWIREWQNAVAR
jgi:thiamine transport system substrate-binding protein